LVAESDIMIRSAKQDLIDGDTVILPRKK
jgi:hypothetical protein